MKELNIKSCAAIVFKRQECKAFRYSGLKKKVKEDILVAAILYNVFIYVVHIYIYIHASICWYDLVICILPCGICDNYQYISMPVIGMMELQHDRV